MVSEAAANLLSDNSFRATFWLASLYAATFVNSSLLEPPNKRVREKSYTDLASDTVFLSYHSYLSEIRSTSPTEVPSQRIGETRCTDLASGKVFTVLSPGLTATGRVSQRREWLLLGTFTRAADGEDERFAKES
ncbi:hypothetical protein BOTNAR_0332g00160 [Botryotinia narcissicola]|uniref:Uncharacterized protein n=1 Tax=Botryotinia narcissicola TaxID=278944 RepID=A0A4Z1HSX3_9HELO|nr:hypothetical protein BOTNAR_0332g00160 [Botryotinia narcissicola]